MDLYVLDTTLKTVGILDTMESLIWAERYSEYGDFEIYTTINVSTVTLLREDYYLILKGSDKCMIIEDINIESDIQKGNKLIVTGRSLESILDRRIIWNQTNLSGSFQDAIHQLLNENAITPTDPDRTIDLLYFEESADPIITALTVEAQFTGENLYDVICSMCDSKEIGFRIILGTHPTTGNPAFIFKLYAGTDRSYNQTTNPYVVFSPKFDNIIGSDYYQSSRPFKTITLVAGEGEGTNRKVKIVPLPGDPYTGLNRREKFTDARDISSVTSEGTLTEESYLALLEERGFRSLADSMTTVSFEGQVDATRIYIYGTDFFIGDIVQVENEYGQEGQAIVIEILRSESSTGLNIYPTFKSI